MLDTQGSREVQPFLHQVQKDRMGAVGLGGHGRGKADGTRADDGAVLSRRQAAAVDSVEGNGQRLRHGCLDPTQIIRLPDQHVRGMAVVFRHASVHMDAQHMQARAAVGPADAAGIAVPAVEVGIHHHRIARLQPLRVAAVHLDHLARQLMSDDAGIGNQSVRPAEGADVAAADPGRMDPEQGLSLFRLRHRKVYTRNVPGFVKFDRFHLYFLDISVFPGFRICPESLLSCSYPAPRTGEPQFLSYLPAFISSKHFFRNSRVQYSLCQRSSPGCPSTSTET